MVTFDKVIVLGSGLMGAGICQVTAESGMKVVLCDIKDEFLEKAKKGIHNSLARVFTKKAKKSKTPSSPEMIARQVETVMKNISFSSNADESVKDASLVIEAVPEILTLKRKIFTGLDKAAPAHCIFTTNTSSLNVKDIACVTRRQDRFGGLHFFNPVPMMKLVEVVKIEGATSDATHEKLLAYCQEINKIPITCLDTPGFVVNRLLVPYLIEAMRLLERKVATAADIDLAMQLGANNPMGPLKLADFIGLDTCLNIIEGWHTSDPTNAIFFPPSTLKRLVLEGNLGRKTGKGFYDYSKKNKKSKL